MEDYMIYIIVDKAQIGNILVIYLTKNLNESSRNG